MKRKTWIPLVLASFLLSSCALFRGGPVERWQEREVGGIAWENLLEVGRLAMVQARFPAIQVVPEAGRIQSGWRNDLSPYSREEHRQRATILIENKGPDLYLVRTRVEVEGNVEMKSTMNPAEAKWEPREDHVEAARFLLQFVLLKTKEFGPSDEFYKKKPWTKE